MWARYHRLSVVCHICVECLALQPEHTQDGSGEDIDNHTIIQLEMCSCSTKGRASLVIEAEGEGEADEEEAGAGVAEAEAAEAEVMKADVTGKCSSIRTWPLH